MRFTDTLPMPALEAQIHSTQLVARIHQAIQDAGGSLPFAQFMHMALYEPELGYYVAGLRKIGKDGDFVTAPEISALFSQCLANQCAQVLNELGGGDILELGAGSGIMAADILTQLETRECLPQHYYILDVSPELRDRQYHTLQRNVPHLLERVTWLDSLPAQPLRGVILGNEVLDAMPVELFRIMDGEMFALAVSANAEGFAFVTAAHAQPSPYPALPDGYTSEYNPALPAWLQSVADCLTAGVVLLIDYGYEAREYYHPERSQGTLICHYQHRVHDNPLVYVGLQDITASVDFTAVADAGLDAGLELYGYTTQAMFLASSGLEQAFLAALQARPEQQYALAQQVRLLSLPSEMGDRFKVIALGKDYHSVLMGFQLDDRRYRL